MTQTNTKRIVIITTAQPSTNPRMVKEYLALKQAGYQVKVLYSFAVQWAADADEKLIKEYGLDRQDFKLVGGSPSEQKLAYFVTRISKKLADRFLKGSLLALSRTSFFLLQEAKKHPADLYIAHTLGALPAVIAASRKHKAKVGFDAEDFHRGEMTMGRSLFEKNKAIEEKYIPLLDYITAASPMITDQYRKIFPKLPSLCINNCFSLRYLNSDRQNRQGNELKLWWFSQKIGPGRGLDQIIKAIGVTRDPNISLTLVGNITQEMRNTLHEWIQSAGMSEGQLSILPPAPEFELFEMGRKYDIGLALETGLSDNLKYCLANKIFTYLLAGNAIIFSDTPAQRAFLAENPSIGSCYEHENINQLAGLLKEYARNKELVLEQQQASVILAKETYNWELESKKLVAWIEEQLGNKQQAPKL